MANGILVKSQIMASNVDTLNKTFKTTSTDVPNCSVFKMGDYSADGTFGVVTPTADDGLKNLWMAGNPNVVSVKSGDNIYRGIDKDERNYTNYAKESFDGFQPKVNDTIELTADGIEGTASAYVVAQEGKLNLKFATAPIDGLSFKVLETTTYGLCTGKIGERSITSYLLLCVAE